jgi:phosphoglycolate phosphatase-like HAD superfamily hydrolase
MKTGKAAGAAVTVGVSWGFRAKSELTESGADVIVDSPLEILNYIG